MRFQQPAGTVKLFILLFLGFALGGCASGPSILSDHDRSAPFESYSTYNLMEGAGLDENDYQSFFSTYVIESITVEMENRGYTKSDNPDLLVNFNARLQDKTKVRTTAATTATEAIITVHGVAMAMERKLIYRNIRKVHSISTSSTTRLTSWFGRPLASGELPKRSLRTWKMS